MQPQDQRQDIKDPRDFEDAESKSNGKEKATDGQFHFPPILHRAETAPHFNYAPPAGKQRYDQFVAASEGPETSEHQEQPQPIHPPEFAHLRTTTATQPTGFDFGFSQAATTASEFQRSLMTRPGNTSGGGEVGGSGMHQIDGGWSVEHGRPDLGAMLKEWATGGPDGRGILGRRTAVFVCGPPAMRVGVANTVARLQAEIWGDPMLEEIFLHTENYNL